MIVVGGLFWATRDTLAEWAREAIQPTLQFYGKTEDDLWKEVAELERKYEEEMGKTSEELVGGVVIPQHADTMESFLQEVLKRGQTPTEATKVNTAISIVPSSNLLRIDFSEPVSFLAFTPAQAGLLLGALQKKCQEQTSNAAAAITSPSDAG